MRVIVPSYEVLALIGAGGMGEVYRARDIRLNRDVALKVLPEIFGRDPDRLARFKREAQLLASLNDPHIAAIYGFEETDGPGPKTPISSEGGVQARWRHDGKELFYLGPDNRLMAVPIRFDAQGQSVEVGTPVSLFAPHLGGTPQNRTARNYMVSRDGQRFLVDTLKEVTLPITVILNWKPKP